MVEGFRHKVRERWTDSEDISTVKEDGFAGGFDTRLERQNGVQDDTELELPVVTDCFLFETHF